MTFEPISITIALPPKSLLEIIPVVVVLYLLGGIFILESGLYVADSVL